MYTVEALEIWMFTNKDVIEGLFNDFLLYGNIKMGSTMADKEIQQKLFKIFSSQCWIEEVLKVAGVSWQDIDNVKTHHWAYSKIREPYELAAECVNEVLTPA